MLRQVPTSKSTIARRHSSFLQSTAAFFRHRTTTPLVLLPILAAAYMATTNTATTSPSSPFYGFKVNDISHKAYDLGQLKGKVVLVVNVASKCGFTPQYKGLEALYQKLKDQGLVIVGFPCNQFGGQEPEKEEGIATFCERNFGVTFPLMEKIDVNGDNAHPLYEWMKSEKTQFFMKRVTWNFVKFLVDKDGRVVERYASTTSPESLEGKIKELLGKQ